MIKLNKINKTFSRLIDQENTEGDYVTFKGSDG